MEISATVDRLAAEYGNLRSIGGPGYRVYYAIDGKRVVLLLEVGDKRTQPQDISRAIERWNDWQQRSRR